MRTQGFLFVALTLAVFSAGCGASAGPVFDDTVPVGTLAPASAPAPQASVPVAVEPTPSEIDARYADEVDGLIMRLFNEDDAVRTDGARELAAMGRHAGPALPYLRDCERQGDGDSARECAAAADYIEGLETATANR